MMALHREWAASMRALGDAHRATIVKFLGDGCVAAFEDPLDSLAFTREFQQAVAAAEASRSRPGSMWAASS